MGSFRARRAIASVLGLAPALVLACSAGSAARDEPAASESAPDAAVFVGSSPDASAAAHVESRFEDRARALDAGDAPARLDAGLTHAQHATCTWSCEHPILPAACVPSCAPPSCSILCGPPAATPGCTCETRCDPPRCTTTCGKDACEGDSCPACETRCEPTSCHVACTPHVDGGTCAPSLAQCFTQCQAPQCSWSCGKPVASPPACSLVCDEGAGRKGEPPPSSPAGGGCHPECSFMCDDPVCEADVTYACPKPVCQRPTCSDPDCTCDEWPDPEITSCASSGECVATKKGKSCHTKAGAACSCEAACKPMACERRLPSSCRAPRCELMCERPACSAQ